MAQYKKRKKKVKKFPKGKPGKPVRIKFSTEPKEPAAEPETKPGSPKITPHPTAGHKVLDFEDRLDDALEAATEKRGRGRPRKQPEPAEPEPQEVGLDIVKPVVKIPFDLWAASNELDELKITDQEAAQIAAPLKTLLDYYLPRIPTIAYAWLSLAVVSYTISKPRLELIAQTKKMKTPAAAGGQDDRNKKSGRQPAAPGFITTPKTLQKFPSKKEPERVSH